MPGTRPVDVDCSPGDPLDPIRPVDVDCSAGDGPIGFEPLRGVVGVESGVEGADVRGVDDSDVDALGLPHGVDETDVDGDERGLGDLHL